jgi:hypothetical protein
MKTIKEILEFLENDTANVRNLLEDKDAKYNFTSKEYDYYQARLTAMLTVKKFIVKD